MVWRSLRPPAAADRPQGPAAATAAGSPAAVRAPPRFACPCALLLQVLLPVGEAPEAVFQKYASLIVRHRQARWELGAGRSGGWWRLALRLSLL